MPLVKKQFVPSPGLAQRLTPKPIPPTPALLARVPSKPSPRIKRGQTPTMDRILHAAVNRGQALPPNLRLMEHVERRAQYWGVPTAHRNVVRSALLLFVFSDGHSLSWYFFPCFPFMRMRVDFNSL